MDAETFFGQIIPDAINAAAAALEERVVAAEASGDDRAAGLRARLDGVKSVVSTLRFEVSEGGRDYYYNLADGALAVGDTAASDPVAWITQSLADFDALQAAGATPVIGGGEPSSRGTGLLKPALADKVRALDNVLKFVISDLPGGGDAATLVRLGAATRDEPDVTISLSLSTYQQMSSGQLAPPAAFMTGALKVEGDMALLMQLAQLGTS